MAKPKAKNGRWMAGCLLAALLLFGGEVLYVDALLAPARVAARPETDILAQPADNYTHAALAAMRCAAPPAPGTLRIYAMGGSSVRECMYEDASMDKRLAKALGRGVEFVNLATFDQSIVETLILAGGLHFGPDTVLVLGVNPRLACSGPDKAMAYALGGRIPFLTDTAAPLLQEVAGVEPPASWVPRLYLERAYVSRYLQERFQSPLLKQVTRYVQGKDGFPRGGSVLQFRKVEFYMQHPFPDTVLPETRKREYAYRIRRDNIDQYKENSAFAFGLVDRLLALAQDKGARVLVMESPRSEISFNAYAPVMADFEASMEGILTARGIDYMRFPKAEFSERDFYDLDHLTGSGRDTYVRLFTTELVRRLDQPQPTEAGQ